MELVGSIKVKFDKNGMKKLEKGDNDNIVLLCGDGLTQAHIKTFLQAAHIKMILQAAHSEVLSFSRL